MNQCGHQFWTKENATAVRLAGGFDGGLLETTLARAWPVERETPFTELLYAIAQAERRRSGDARHFG